MFKLRCYECLKKQYPLISKNQLTFSEQKRICPICQKEGYIVIAFSNTPQKDDDKNCIFPLRLD